MPVMKAFSKRAFESNTLRVISALAGGNFLATLIGVLGSLVQARYVSPADLGYFRGFTIATGYAFFFHLGLLDAMQRLYPYYVGKGDDNRARSIAEICQAWMAGVTVVVSGAFVLMAAVSLWRGNERAMLGWLVQALAMVGFIYGGYMSATYRSGHDFTSLAKGGVYSSIASVLVLPLFLLWPYFAMAVRSGISSLVNILYLHARRPLRLKLRFAWGEWFELVKGGIPIFVASYGAATLWSVVETSLVLRFLGAGALGLWSMGFMVLEAANKVPQAVTAVYVPRLTETLGRTSDVAACLRLCKKPLAFGVPAMIALAVVGSLALRFLVPVVMPKYIAAIPTMSLMLLMLPLIVLDTPYAILVAMGKILHQNVAVYAGLGSFALLALAAINLGFGLNGVVAASLVGRVVRLVAVYTSLYRVSRYPVVAEAAMPAQTSQTEA